MAILVKESWAGLQEIDYFNTSTLLDLQAQPPRGLITHAAWRTKDGMAMCDVWESEADYQAFVKNQLTGALGALSIVAKPKTEILQLVNVFRPVTPADCEAYDQTTHAFATS
jgi:hypothetical protein